MKRKLLLALFWAVQLTWGLLENLAASFVFLALVATGHKPKRFHQMVYFEIGENWGGFNLGFVAIVHKNVSESTLRHEHGHFIQTFMFGPFQIFIQIASAARYWYREYIYRTDPMKYTTLPDYDAIWFEGQATRFGYKYLARK